MPLPTAGTCPRRTGGPATFPAAWRHKAGRAPVIGARAMVASDAPLASAAGVEILKRGGNAVDAAVAVGFALAVTYPEAGNIGGGGYMVIHMADGRAAAIDYREIAPLAATRDMYLDASGKLTDKSVVGPLASGVPGAVAGMTEALAKYGTMSLADVMAPAIRSRRGLRGGHRARQLDPRQRATLIGQFSGKSLFLPEWRAARRSGTTLKQPALARDARAIAAKGRSGVLRRADRRGVDERAARAAAASSRWPISRGYKPVWREPVRSTYRGYTLFTMPPSSSGGVTITETLNILEGFDSLPAFGSAGWVHLVGSAYQRAFIDRNEKLADPAFVNVPIAQLTDKA